MPFLLFFALFALLDFVVLFSVGSQIGLLTTLVLVLATGFVGLHLVRREGVATLQRAQVRLAQGELPSQELLTGAALIFGGALLLAPGFLSDLLGFACLIPSARSLLGRLLTRTGLYMQGGRRPDPGDWSAPHHDDVSHSPTDDPAGGNDDTRPLEGDFISKDEPHR